MKQIVSHFQKAPYFLLLIPVYYLLYLVEDYHPLFTYRHLLELASLFFVFTGILCFAFCTWFRPKGRDYSVAFAVVFIIYLYFDPIRDSVKSIFPSLAKYSVLLPVLLVLLFALFRQCSRMQGKSPRLYLYFNTLMAILTLLTVFQVGNANLQKQKVLLPAWLDAGDSMKMRPDIYYIVFDGYSASRTLKEHWGYDNSGIDTFLRAKGYYNANLSTSNYNFTPLSIGSILNLDYYKKIETDTINFRMFWTAARDIRHTVLPSFLAKHGYRIVNHSIFELEGENKPPMDFSYLNDRRKLIFAKTLSYCMIDDLGWNFNLPDWLVKIHRKTNKELLDIMETDLEKLVKNYSSVKATSARRFSEPVFVYGHFVLPHDPYYFDSLSNVFPKKEWMVFDGREKATRYLQQVKHTNTWIRDLSTTLVHDAKRPRVIIFQSDHGYRSFIEKKDSCLEFNNLTAVYFPDGDYKYLYDSISAVNTFRVVLKKYFKEEIPLLKDSAVYLRH
ncbi:sulfatase-like hydrolase/transferase [Flavihumibacter solisilvae]|uniref:Sulfatase N-terminal domain-containing protein n=1 Tax=Flavihumibacter solisilvae TaxID=1349421 RepID=A0A0C1L0F6_9BACT|nr:sulfatase-like hydrolase/transferase [Flavihumibacter solisilvae]KIC93467.1 hypothetical protein OI18_17045 [Flavihumibacter solisilvae]